MTDKKKQPQKPKKNTPVYVAGATPNAPPEDDIGKRIKDARKKDDLSIEALSRLCKEYDPHGQGISSTALLRYESGTFNPGARELRILCDALDVSANWLLLGINQDSGINLDEAFTLLRNLIAEHAQQENPLRWGGDGFKEIVRQEKLRRAKKPT